METVKGKAENLMKSQQLRDGSSLLDSISLKAKLEEGGEGVRKTLREVYRSRKISTKKLAYLTGLPVPVTAALRRELENEGLLARKDGACLTAKGERFVTKQLGLTIQRRLTCSTCQGRHIQTPEEYKPVFQSLELHLRTRPKPKPQLDQTLGTAETVISRALYMLDKGDVEGRAIIFLGDDDFTSVAVGLLKAAENITVVDVDSRILEALKHVSKKENLNINCVQHDLTEPLPADLRHKYDIVFTDPPYTIAGVTLFVSRGITALKTRKSASVYLAFAHQSPKNMLKVQKALNTMGLALVEQTPRFNVYEGAEMWANTTCLMRLETTEKTKPLITEVEAFNSKLYSGEVTQTTRTYECHCGEQTNVGATEAVQTIEELKAKGCPRCGATKGFKLVKRRKLKESLGERLKIKNFGWEHFPEVLEFEREVAKKSFPDNPILDENYHRDKLEKALKRERAGLKVGFLNNEAVGWLWLRTEKDRNTKEKFGYVKTIIVKPEHRHRGLGRRLMEAAKQYFQARGVSRVDAIVSASNREAAFFFEEVGFETQHSTMRSNIKSQRK